MRVLLRVLSPLLGVALAGAGALLVVVVARQWSGRGWPPWPDWSWADRPVLPIGACLAVGGLFLLVVASRAGVSQVPLDDPADGVRVVTTPTSLARVVGHRVRAEDGVADVAVTASRRRVRVRVTSRLHGEASLRPRLLEVARGAVDDLPMSARPKVSVVVISPKDCSIPPKDLRSSPEDRDATPEDRDATPEDRP
ncbi:DUF6286 domain-containing protein [Saccharothrix texasensis]|uniref:DUF6286 domain-containing protein n=1 Tax=Saccharothrix texasensis TaxID=103734 RepID=A0A3N1H4G5_9PSEU|nr:DUF6286 domain-containing protein [Saccharothrix texasensis]ROP37405.1 hypothetical protein EDD40_2718 [Saccharothrix texasensis]